MLYWLIIASWFPLILFFIIQFIIIFSFANIFLLLKYFSLCKERTTTSYRMFTSVLDCCWDVKKNPSLCMFWFGDINPLFIILAAILWHSLDWNSSLQDGDDVRDCTHFSREGLFMMTFFCLLSNISEFCLPFLWSLCLIFLCSANVFTFFFYFQPVSFQLIWVAYFLVPLKSSNIFNLCSLFLFPSLLYSFCFPPPAPFFFFLFFLLLSQLMVCFSCVSC